MLQKREAVLKGAIWVAGSAGLQIMASNVHKVKTSKNYETVLKVFQPKRCPGATEPKCRTRQEPRHHKRHKRFFSSLQSLIKYSNEYEYEYSLLPVKNALCEGRQT